MWSFPQSAVSRLRGEVDPQSPSLPAIVGAAGGRKLRQVLFLINSPSRKILKYKFWTLPTKHHPAWSLLSVIELVTLLPVVEP
jgi:hypothetical protein